MTLHITMRQLQVFETVARHLSFTKAAAELHLTQPAVSMQVKQLESMVELPLFELIGKKVHLTAAGEVMVQHSRTMNAHLKDIERDIDNLKGVEGSQLKICIASTVNYFATRLLSKFCEQYKNVHISLDVINRDELIRRLEANQPDLVLMGQPPEELDVVATAFMENPLILISNPQNHLVGKSNVDIHQLSKEVIVTREPGSGNGQVAQSVEQGTENPRVGSSILSLATLRMGTQTNWTMVKGRKCLPF